MRMVRSAKEGFAGQLTALWKAAGEPTLAHIVRGTEKYSTNGLEVAPRMQRISDWRNAKSTPQRFAHVEPVIQFLIAEADEALDPQSLLRDRDHWHELWSQSRRRRSAVLPAGQCPYMGLNAFSADDADRFHGRSRSLMDLIARLENPSIPAGLFLLCAASGTGKSSILQAGLVATARANGLTGTDGPWWTVTFIPGPSPCDDLLQAIPALAKLDTGYVHAVREIAGADSHTGTLIVVDQFEQIFTACPDEPERSRFLAMLDGLAAADTDDWPVRVVLGLRADFMSDCMKYEPLRTALENRQIVLGPMAHDELTEAIEQPARDSRLVLEPGLADVIIRDLDAAGGGDRQAVLPLMSHVLESMWNRRYSTGGRLTLSLYQAVGQVEGSVNATAERAWHKLDRSEREAAPAMLLSLVQIGDGSRDTRRTVPKSELVGIGGPGSAHFEKITQALVDERLLTIDGDGGVSFTHEIVISSWELLRTWIDADHSTNLTRQRLDRDATEWDRHGRYSSDLYTGARLAEIEARLDGHALAPLSEEFRQQSLGWRRTRRNRWKAFVAFLVFLVVALFVSTVRAQMAENDANEARDDAQFRATLSNADRLQRTDPSLSAQLDLVARRLRSTSSDTTSRILGTQDSPLATLLLGHTGPIYAATYRPDGSVIATASGDHTARLWDISDPAAPALLGAPLEGHKTFLTSATWSPDGTVLATSGGDGTVRLWDVRNPSNATLIGHSLATAVPHGTVYATSISPDGRTLAAPTDDGTTIIWDISDPSHPVERTMLTGPSGPARSTAISPDGRLLAVGSDDTTVWLWDISDPASITPAAPPLNGFVRSAHSVAFSPDGTTLAAVSDDRTLRLWNVTDPCHPTPYARPIEVHSGAVWSVAFGPDTQTLATASWDGSAQLWNLVDPNRPRAMGQPLTGSDGGVITVAISPDQSSMITGSHDGVLRMWTVPTSVIDAHSDRVMTPRFNADGTRMATASVDGSLQIWDTSNQPTRLGRAVAPNRQIDNLLITRDGGTVLTIGGHDGKLHMWNTADPSNVRPLREPLPLRTRYAYALALSPDGRTLATGSADNSVQLWDVSTMTSPTPLGEAVPVAGDLLTALAFSPDGRTLAAAATTTTDITVIDVASRSTPKVVATLSGHTKQVEALAFSPSSGLLASGSDDITVRLWDLSNPTAPQAHGEPLQGQDSNIRSVAFSSDGRSLAAGTDSGAVHLWENVDSAAPSRVGGSVANPAVPTRWYVEFHPTAGVLAGGGEGGALRFWNLSLTAASARICSATHGVLSETVWSQQVPDLRYNPPC